MNKVFILAPNEDWIVDRFVTEFYRDNPDVCSSDPSKADVIWLLADWCADKFDFNFLKTKKVITSVHHIVPEKFSDEEREKFSRRDDVTTVYHVYNQRTFDFIRPLTSKPIHLICYWANQKIWRKTGTKEFFRRKYNISDKYFLVGSFQRDTEGFPLVHGVVKPKLEKGPDLLCDALIKMKHQYDDLHVLLAGPRRQYVMERLRNKVPFTYLGIQENLEALNDLYQTLDLYLVTARHEGGPQSLIECGLLGVHCVSRPVGIAEQVLPPESVCDDVTLGHPRIPDVESWKVPKGYSGYRKLIAEL